MIRQTRPIDALPIALIWNRVIRDTAATFTTVEKTAQSVAEAMDRQPFLVAERDGRVAGFATYAPFRAGPGYAHTMEHSIHITADARGQGLGKTLLQALERHARQAGVRHLIAAIGGENTDGAAFHTAMGYTEVGRLPQVGWKFDRWHDLVLMQKIL